MPIVRIQAAENDSCIDFDWFLSRFPPHTGGIYFTDNSELNVPEEGSVSFSNNHADYNGGEYCHPCHPR